MFDLSNVVAAFLVSVVVSNSNAGETSDGFSVVDHIFQTADTDQDGVLTRAEHDAAGLQKYGVKFEDFDANEDGSISISEYRTLYEKHHNGAVGSDA